jgi:hypothetical protein
LEYVKGLHRRIKFTQMAKKKKGWGRRGWEEKEKNENLNLFLRLQWDEITMGRPKDLTR